MRVLGLELSSGQGSVAWLDDDRPPFLRSFANNRKHSGLFFENLECVTRQFPAPELIAVGIGPGSYAGVRIAIAAAIGLRAASSAKLVGIPSVCALDAEVREYGVIGDARRQSFFFAHVMDGKLSDRPSLHSGTELEARIMKFHAPVYTSESLPQFPQAIAAFPSASRLVELARAQSNEMADTGSLEPIYLREPHITLPRMQGASSVKR